MQTNSAFYNEKVNEKGTVSLYSNNARSLMVISTSYKSTSQPFLKYAFSRYVGNHFIQKRLYSSFSLCKPDKLNNIQGKYNGLYYRQVDITVKIRGK